MGLIFLVSVGLIFISIVRGIDHSTLIGKFLNYTISFENRFYDFRMNSLIDPKFKSDEIVLIEIDDYSLQKLGMWPIPRTEHAKMIDKLGEFGAKVVALDILFPEKSPPFNGISPDEILATSMKNFQKTGGRIFLGYSLTFNQEQALPEAPVEMLNDVLQTKTKGDFRQKKINRYTFPIQELVESEVGLGIIEAEEDSDGIFRQYPIAANIDTIYYGSLAFNSFEAYLEKKTTIITQEDGSGELEVKGKKMEIGPTGEVKIRYVGARDQFLSIPLYTLLTTPSGDEKMKKALEGKIVFVGSTALGAHDLRPSPVDNKMPGVYAHMNVAHMLIHQYFYQNTSESIRFSLILLVLSMVIFILIQKLGNAFLDALVVIGILYGYYLADRYYFLPNGYELKLFYSFFCIIFCYSWNTFLKFYDANKEKKQIKGTFARYVAPTVVDEMLKDPDKLHVGGTKMDITCLFSDVRDFTKISETLSASELSQSLNTYMGAMTDIVFNTKGTLDKYIGDAIVALWGAPLPIGNHAQYAVEAAIKMMEALPLINEEFKKLGRPQFQVGVGLNSGECSVGNMGSERIFSYTALGDNMNLGSRLESLCKYYGTQILISQMTMERIDLSKIKIRPIDKVVVKGKTLAVGIYEVLHEHHWLTKDEESLKDYLKAHELFEKKEFQNALELFSKIHAQNEKDKPTIRLRDLCQKFLLEPDLIDENFNVTIMKEK